MTDPDERFSIEGDPEDALRALMATGKLPEWVVSMSEAEGREDYPEGSVGDNEDTPAFRVSEWRGNAPDKQGALAQAEDAWSKEFGGPPTSAFRAVIKRV